jgi:hypothetical protein
VCPPVREFLFVWRVRDLPEVSTIRSRCEDVMLVRARQIEREHETLAVRRPARSNANKQVAAALQYAHEQKIIYLHRCAEDPVGFQQQVLDFLRQFQAGSTDLLRHVGLLPKELKERMT